ncbi:MAG: permease-like cell division protein FtsX [Xanthomonadales bacterium]|nr:permease-like cell division protein FtsX [Xanthomonadales bacterium]
MSSESWINRMRRRNRAWIRRHSYSFFSSLGVLFKHKAGTFMTVMVLGIAMFLPLGLYITLSNLEGMNLRQDEWSAVTVFFKAGATEADVRRVAEELEKRLSPEAVVIISPAEGMADFRDASGFGESLDMLEENPLPWVMQVSPQRGSTEQVEERVAELTSFFQSLDSIEVTQFDYKWLQRLGRMMELGQATVTVLILLFGLAVVVVVANTIRLDVASHAEEIEILALVGAGNAFVRQPFLYLGLWYGLMGGLLAVILLGLTVLYLGRPLGLLLETYGSVFSLQGLGGQNTLWVLLGGGFLGWLGAWISVQRYLQRLKVGGRLGRS